RSFAGRPNTSLVLTRGGVQLPFLRRLRRRLHAAACSTARHPLGGNTFPLIIRDPVTIDMPCRSDLTFEQIAHLVEWAVQSKHNGDIPARGTGPAYPGSTFWELRAPVRIIHWPTEGRTWVVRTRLLNPDADRIVGHLESVLVTHPGTRH